MPTKPEPMVLNANSAQILNAIRSTASATYQDRIPQATRDNIREIGNAMMQYQSTQNEFLTSLVNRIGRVIITSKMYENPLREFKKGMLEFGETVEEIFVRIAQAHPFNQEVAEDNVFKREIPNVEAVFHRLNVKNFYKATISNDMLRQAFLSWQGITDLIARIVDSMYAGANYDEFLYMKQLIVDYANKGQFYTIGIPAPTADNAKDIVTTIKSISNGIEFMSPEYNAMGVLNYTPKSSQILIIDTRFDAIVDVNVLAAAFNLDKAEFLARRVLIDNFGELTGVVAALVDREWFMVFDNFYNFTELYNGEGLYWNYWYHVWKTFSTSPFSNAILFVEGTPTVTAITVTPATATLTKAQGGRIQLSVNVTGTSYPSSRVTWTVTGGTDITVSPTGLVVIPPGQTADTVTITATSVVDNTKTATATITLT